MADITTGIATIIADEALGQLRANIMTPRLVRQDLSDEVATFGSTVTTQKRGALSVGASLAAAQEFTQLTFAQVADTAKTVVLNQHRAVTFEITDFAQGLNRPEQIMGHAEDAAIVLADFVDADLITFLSATGVPSNSLNVANDADVSVDELIQLETILDGARAPMNDRFAIWAPKAKRVLLRKGIFSGSTEAGAAAGTAANAGLSLPGEAAGSIADAVLRGMLGERFGIMHFMDQNVSTYQSSANSQSNVAFHRDAMVYVNRMLPGAMDGAGAVSMPRAEGGISLRVTIDYDITQLSHRVVVDHLWGRNLHRPEFVISIPTIIP